MATISSMLWKWDLKIVVWFAKMELSQFTKFIAIDCIPDEWIEFSWKFILIFSLSYVCSFSLCSFSHCENSRIATGIKFLLHLQEKFWLWRRILHSKQFTIVHWQWNGIKWYCNATMVFSFLLTSMPGITLNCINTEIKEKNILIHQSCLTDTWIWTRCVCYWAYWKRWNGDEGSFKENFVWNEMYSTI